MCLINFQYSDHPQYKLVVVANRDEEYARPSKEAHFWEDEPTILAGRDLLQMGTWLGVSTSGKFAAITNFRDPKIPARPRSRGDIIKHFLSKSKPISDVIEELKNKRELYGGYNVLLFDGKEFVHYNNSLDEFNRIQPGTHSLSNHTLNTPWPKVVNGRTRLQHYLEQHEEVAIEQLFEIVLDAERAKDEELPSTGVGLELERALSSMFIKIPNYGTRTSTIVLIDHLNQVTFVERTYEDGHYKFDSTFKFTIV